jgi:hypothetical protein
MTPALYPTSDQVLDEFAASADRPTPELVRAWIERYPQFAQDIVDYATEWVELLMAEGMEPVESDNAPVDKAMSRLQAMLREKDNASTRGLLQAIASSGRSSEQVANDLGLDRSVMLLFDAGLVVTKSIPTRIWQSLQVFSLPPIVLRQPIPNQQLVTARRAPSPLAPAQPVTFRRAIELSALPEDAKQRWFEALDRD